MRFYEDAVGEVLEQATVGADLVAAVVEELQREATPDPLVSARIRRERAAASQKLERDRDTEVWQATMRRLDAEEAAATASIPDVVPARDVVTYLRDLPETCRHAAGGRGRRMVAEALFSAIRVLGMREMEFVLTPHAAALGLAEALPSTGFEISISGYGRGERI